jgi:transposase
LLRSGPVPLQGRQGAWQAGDDRPDSGTGPRESTRAFDRVYAREGRPSIPSERLLRALLLQAFYTVRSERQLMEQLDYNMLFRWFVGLSADDPVWDATVFCKNRDWLLDGDIAAKFFASVLNLPQVRRLLSSEHFSVDGTLIEAWASVPKEGRKPPSGKAAAGAAGAIPSATSMARSAGTIPIPRPPTPMPGCSAKRWQRSQALLHGASDDGEP